MIKLFVGLLLAGCGEVSANTPSSQEGDPYAQPDARSFLTPVAQAITAETPAEAGQPAAAAETSSPPAVTEIEEYPVPSGSHPHDVAPAPDGTVWYTAQNSGALGRLDPISGATRHIPLGSGSAPHGV
ncbi:MAG: hypothetical protein ACRDHG_14245, partial [Anaerolineales bacterium]